MDVFITGGPYADYVMAGATDPFFRWLTADQIPLHADGNVEAPTGWFCLVKPEREDLIYYTQVEDGSPFMTRYVKANQWYLVEINTLGFVHTFAFDGLDGLRSEAEQYRRAIATFSYYTRHYIKWADYFETGAV